MSDDAYRKLLEEHTQLQARHRLLERLVHLYGAPDQFEQVFEGVLDALMDAFPIQAATIYVIDAEKDELYIAAARGPKSSELIALDVTLVPGQGIAGACYQENQVLTVSDSVRDDRLSSEIPAAIDYPVHSLVSAPMTGDDGQPLGVLQLLNRTGGTAFTADEVETLTRLGRQVGALVALGWRLRNLQLDALEEAS